MATINSITRELSQNPQAVRKRNYRSVQREKKRRSIFIHDYVRTKYPSIFNQANEMYQYFVDKYPSKVDFTKLYYFKKWQKKMDESRSRLFLPHLPILSSPDTLQRAATSHQQSLSEQEPGEQSLSEQEPGEQSLSEQEPGEQSLSEQEPGEQSLSEQQPDEQSPSEQEPLLEERIEVIQSDVQNTQEANHEFTGMSLDEMSLAVEEIVTALQSDRELMDIVEGFDLPDSVWQNELSIPDYVLETELEW